MTVRVVVVDDHDLVRAGLCALLDGTDDIAVVGEAGDGDRALAVTREARPDVLLVDLRMPGRDGIATIASIRADPAIAATAVLVVTTFDDDIDIDTAIAAGADGYLLKDLPPDDLRRAVRSAARGEATLSPAIARRLMDRTAARTARPAPHQGLTDLTPRERQVLSHVAAGRSNREIAEALHISPHTARTHVSRLLTKLGARDRARLVALAHEQGVTRAG